ncbi:MAG: alpha hydrolase [Halobacteriaceae archaeon]
MRVACLFSGGVDSALAALLLEPFCEVVLVTGSFGVTESGDTGAEPEGHAGSEAAPADPAAAAATAADALDLPHRRVALDPAVARSAVETMAADGYPRNGIQAVHEHALEVVADGAGEQRDGRDAGGANHAPVDAVADGTRRDDRVPTVSLAGARSLEDRHGVSYLRPLAGIGRRAVDALAASALTVERGPSERLATGDYETELRALLAAEHGAGAVEAVFPDHEQSRVTGRR